LFLCATFFAKKSIPTVGYVNTKNYMRGLIKSIMYILFYDTGFANRLISKKDNFNFNFSSNGAYRMIHKMKFS